MPVIVFANKDGSTNVIPIIAAGSKLVFRTTTPNSTERREELANEYTEKLGMECEFINYGVELVAVIDG